MWSDLGNRIRAFFVVLLIMLLSLVMGIVGFSGPTLEGCRPTGPSFAARVYGETVSAGEFQSILRLIGASRLSPEQARVYRVRELTMDSLVERKLLVREARRLGFDADREEVMRRVVQDEEVLYGGPVEPAPGFPRGAIGGWDFSDRSGNFDPETLKRFIQNYLRRSVDEFTDWQVEETLAARVRDAVTTPVAVSPGEVWDTYVDETERARIRYVRFDPDHYRELVEPTDEAVEAWMAAHPEEVDAEYVRQRHRYTDVQEQVRARYLLVEVERNADDEAREAARARAEELLARARAGEDFVALVEAHSDDEATASRGGDLGWVPRGRRTEAFDEAVFDLNEGEVVDAPIESSFGFSLVRGEDRREAGDVPEDEAKRELAEGLFVRAEASARARAEAERALAYLRDGHTAEELDERRRLGWADPAAPAAPDDDAESGGSADAGELADADAGDEDPAEEEDPRGPLAPRVEESRSFRRSQPALTGDFDSTPLTEAAYAMSLDDPLPEAPIALGDSFVVFELIELTKATQDDFDAETEALVRERLLSEKRDEVLRVFVGRLRARAQADGALRVEEALLRYGDEDAEGDEDVEPS
ncbi:MAG: peptidylprolyl isomerase [Sandaracinaceae bacterium]